MRSCFKRGRAGCLRYSPVLKQLPRYFFGFDCAWWQRLQRFT